MDTDDPKTDLSSTGPAPPATPNPASTVVPKRVIPPEYLKFHESLSAELRAKRDQVFNLIGGVHWGEVGRHREAILKQVIHNHLPKNLSLGTGFVIGRMGITNQIDIIVYDNDVPTLFRQDDFIVVPPDGVRAIIEVKSQHGPSDVRDSVKKASLNGHKILFGHQDRTFQFFNGIFAYEPTSEDAKLYLDAFADGLKEAIAEINSPPYISADPKTLVNHVCFNERFFLKQDVQGFNPDESLLSVFGLGDWATSAFVFRLMLFLQPGASQRAKELYFPYDYDPKPKPLAKRRLSSPSTTESLTSPGKSRPI